MLEKIRIRKREYALVAFVVVVKGAWEQGSGPCNKLTSDPYLCVALRKACGRPQPRPQ